MNLTVTTKEAERTAILNAVWESIDREWLDAGITYAELDQADKMVACLDQQLVAGRPLDAILSELSDKGQASGIGEVETLFGGTPGDISSPVILAPSGKPA